MALLTNRGSTTMTRNEAFVFLANLAKDGQPTDWHLPKPLSKYPAVYDALLPRTGANFFWSNFAYKSTEFVNVVLFATNNNNFADHTIGREVIHVFDPEWIERFLKTEK